MFGNTFDYGNPDVDDTRDEIEAIMAGTRDAVSSLGTGSTYDSIQSDMSDVLAGVGVGNVGSFLEEAYTPYAPTSTPSYSTFMADVPAQIESAIAAKQTAYNAGQEERMQDFQNLLAEVRDYSYGTGSYAPGPADPELDAISMPKFKDGNETKTENSLAEYQELFGDKFTKNEYNELLEGGVSAEELHDNLMAYNAAGGNVGDRVFGLMGYDTYAPDEIPDNLMGPHQDTYEGNLIVPKPNEELESIFSAPPAGSPLDLYTKQSDNQGPVAPDTGWDWNNPDDFWNQYTGGQNWGSLDNKDKYGDEKRLAYMSDAMGWGAYKNLDEQLKAEWEKRGGKDAYKASKEFVLNYTPPSSSSSPSSFFGADVETYAPGVSAPTVTPPSIPSVSTTLPDTYGLAAASASSTPTLDPQPTDVFSNPPATSPLAGYGVTSSTSTQGPLAPTSAPAPTPTPTVTQTPAPIITPPSVATPDPIDPNSLLAKFKDGNEKKLAASMQAYNDQFGNSVSLKEYNNLLNQGVAQNFLKNNLLKYQAAGGTLKDKLSALLNG